jgi:hypothetical protein
VVARAGYTPDLIVVRRQQPVRLDFRRDEASTCGALVVFSDFARRYYVPEPHWPLEVRRLGNRMPHLNLAQLTCQINQTCTASRDGAYFTPPSNGYFRRRSSSGWSSTPSPGPPGTDT